MTKLSSLAADLVRDEGAIARQAGEPRKSNPYPKGSEERGLWSVGWKHAGANDRPDAAARQPNVTL